MFGDAAIVGHDGQRLMDYYVPPPPFQDTDLMSPKACAEPELRYMNNGS